MNVWCSACLVRSWWCCLVVFFLVCGRWVLRCGVVIIFCLRIVWLVIFDIWVLKGKCWWYLVGLLMVGYDGLFLLFGIMLCMVYECVV